MFFMIRCASSTISVFSLCNINVRKVVYEIRFFGDHLRGDETQLIVKSFRQCCEQLIGGQLLYDEGKLEALASDSLESLS